MTFHRVLRASPLVLSLLGAAACSGNVEPPPAPLGDGGDSSTDAGKLPDTAPETTPDADATLGPDASDTRADTQSGDTSEAGADLIIDNFDDGNGESLVGGSWYTYTDVDNGGGSTLTIPHDASGGIVMSGSGYHSPHSLLVSYTFDQGSLTYDPYVGVGLWLGYPTSPFDLSKYAGIQYTYRGGAHAVRIETAEVTDYDYYDVILPESTVWTTVTIPYSMIRQEGWGKHVAFDPHHVTAVSFHIRGTSGQSKTLEIDNLVAIANVGQSGPDMLLLDPKPPTDEVLTSIAITNPLQAKAEKYLDHGMNLSWLESTRFTTWQYGESYVAAVADAGFTSLRLPIDFDLYVTKETSSDGGVAEAGQGDGAATDGAADGATDSATVGGTTLTLHPDLFMVLDQFEAWTAKYHLSLTIDYHQYDHSLDFAKPATMDEAVALWGLVAKHFASNPREDLFYELLNEPDLSAVAAPTGPQWTALAERMIAAIRANDASRTIIFGDVQWYGIDPLTHRTPLADTNIIYSIHDYEPFIFTHQGASWTETPSTHDIPYPYSKDRWSQYYTDLGFNPYGAEWVLSAAADYYETGNKSAIRNHVVQAKRWAVAHNVPVICNEFGAYDLASRLEDRVRYYADVTSIFGELHVPWQEWFTLVNKDGTMSPEIRAALGIAK